MARHAVHCHHADSSYGESLAEALVLDINKIEELKGLTLDELIEATSEEGYKPAKKAASGS